MYERKETRVPCARCWRSGPAVVPVSSSSFNGIIVANETVLEKVEDCKLVPGHDIGPGFSLNFAPYLGQGILEDLADSRIGGAIRALASNLQSLGYRSILRVLARSRRAVDSNAHDRSVFTMRHWELMRVVCLVLLVLVVVDILSCN